MACGGCGARRDAIVKAAIGAANGDAKAIAEATQEFKQSVRDDATRLRNAAAARLRLGRR